MTCKDCIHDKLCMTLVDTVTYEAKATKQGAEKCRAFKNKAEYKKVVYGEWKPNNNLGECSRCGDIVMVKSNFCPTCGADMRGEKQ